MTPRTKQTISDPDLSWFSDALLAQFKSIKSSYDLSGQGSLCDLIHPALIKAKHEYDHSSGELDFRSHSSGWNLIAYKNSKNADLHSNAQSYGGFPWQISQFIKDGPTSAVLHFGEMGSVFLSKAELDTTIPISPEFFHYAMPIWLDYALSPELWGVSGKWTRFHASLHTLFEKYGLLIDQDFPGFYPLDPKAQYLTELGFKGSLNDKNFNLTLPWDFPLSGLKKLEEVIRRGP
jgi:hypothetical protein